MLLFLVFNSFFTSPADNENVRLRLALSISTSIPITVANDAIEMIPLVADKTIKDLSKKLKEAIYLPSLLLINTLSLISAIK